MSKARNMKRLKTSRLEGYTGIFLSSFGSLPPKAAGDKEVREQWPARGAGGRGIHRLAVTAASVDLHRWRAHETVKAKSVGQGTKF